MSDFNTGVIEEFRANHGKVGGPFEGNEIMLLTTIGAKSGKKRVNPLVYTKSEKGIVIIASKGGSPSNPDWYYNIKANPQVEVEVGDDKFKAKAEITDEETRQKLYAQHAKEYPQFLDYAKNTDRAIPVILLSRI
jgi:deazaflavin-dependent oxidoreductase (nitroreductase family)